MPERCFFCRDQKFYCQEPAVPLIQGRWEVSPDGKRLNLNPEKMIKCAKRAEILAHGQ